MKKIVHNIDNTFSGIDDWLAYHMPDWLISLIEIVRACIIVVLPVALAVGLTVAFMFACGKW